MFTSVRSLMARVSKAIANPRFAILKIYAMLTKPLQPRAFVSNSPNRGDSENDGLYVPFVTRATRSYRVFRQFKRHPHYRSVLEHVSREEGTQYINIIECESADLIKNIDQFTINDSVGNPIRYSYPGLGEISPTTLRYLKVASDIRRLFGDLSGMSVAEIGVGYGGQLLVLDQIFMMHTYFLFDLLPVLDLTSKYLESHVLRSSYRTSTLNSFDGDQIFDLVISNYAFSELPSHVQRRYVDKVMRKARRGYITMNSGTRGDMDRGRLSIDQLRELLPRFEIIEERPLTGPHNYIVVWGNT